MILASVLYGVIKVQLLVFFFFLDICQWLESGYKICKTNHFADHTNLLHFSKSKTKFIKYVSLSMKNLIDWLNANKISLNVQKTKWSFLNTKERR